MEVMTKSKYAAFPMVGVPSDDMVWRGYVGYVMLWLSALRRRVAVRCVTLFLGNTDIRGQAVWI